MSKPVVIEPEAEADLAEAYFWYEQRREGLGADFFMCIEVAVQAIGERPKSFPKVRKEVRRVLVNRFPYLILFVEMKDLISVIGIFHTSRNPRRWDKRLR